MKAEPERNCWPGRFIAIPTGERPFIPVNLAAIPKELVESTLFGHERGAFTGAHKQQMGKFELASGGTLFLDEIGDLEIDLQAKLLRAIQEEEIERVGGTKLIKTDFRLIVATNVDLKKRSGWTIQGRPLLSNQRRSAQGPTAPGAEEDLADLIQLFLRRYITKFRKEIEGITDGAVQTLKEYHWPGNVRELEKLD